LIIAEEKDEKGIIPHYSEDALKIGWHLRKMQVFLL
jgi:hypothetical protein